MFKNLVYIAILSTATVASWIGFSVYHNYTTSTIEDATKIRITPIQGEFDREAIERIKSKRTIPANLNEQRVVVTISPTQETEVSDSTPSGEVEL